MKKLISIAITAALLAGGTIAAYASAIPDHSGTPMNNIEVGTASLNNSVKQYIPIFKAAGEQYGVDPNLLAAICMQESSGRNLSYREDGSSYPAWGIMQIEYTLEKSFAAFGERTTGISWTLDDRLDPYKAVPYAAWIISESLYRYDSDYMKMVQAYNFGSTVLDRIIADKGEEWLDYRKDAAKYADGWKYESYGDALYIEHVLRYFHNDIEYRCAKVRHNGKLVKFEDQAPLIINGTTLVPVRAVSQTLGADVKWDDKNYQAVISGNGSSITIPIGSTSAYINGTAYQLGTAAQIMNGRTMVPLRFIAEALDIQVAWEQETRTVQITD